MALAVACRSSSALSPSTKASPQLLECYENDGQIFNLPFGSTTVTNTFMLSLKMYPMSITDNIKAH